eukprot:105610-Pelagomonas_calceolata.AAC.2
MQASCGSAEPDGTTDWSICHRPFSGSVFYDLNRTEPCTKPFRRSQFEKRLLVYNLGRKKSVLLRYMYGSDQRGGWEVPHIELCCSTPFSAKVVVGGVRTKMQQINPSFQEGLHCLVWSGGRARVCKPVVVPGRKKKTRVVQKPCGPATNTKFKERSTSDRKKTGPATKKEQGK